MNRIEQRRKELNLTKQEVCKHAKICSKSYYLYANVGRPIPSDKLLLLAECLQCSTDYILGISKTISEDLATKEIVDILSGREGVEKTIAEPYENIQVSIDGPAIVLTVTD